MKLSNGRLIYDGVQKNLSSKAAFMELAMGSEEVCRRIGEKLIEDNVLREKLTISSELTKNGRMMRFGLEKEDLEVLFNLIFAEKIGEVLEHDDPLMRLYGNAAMQEAQEISLDITYFLLYAVILNEECCRKLEEEIPDGRECYEYWRQSSYNNTVLESYVNTERVWPLRKLTGLLEKLRSEPERGASYRLFMKIIYAGNPDLRRQLRHRRCISGQLVRELVGGKDISYEEQVEVLSKVILLLVVAEDMELKILWDYDMILILKFHQDFSWHQEPSDSEAISSSKADCEEFLNRFDEKYEVHNSLTNLVLYAVDKESDDSLFNLMTLFKLNPRKVGTSKLTEEECRQLLCRSDVWTMKKYRTNLIIAQLCKYIRDLEQVYLRTFEEYEQLRQLNCQMPEEKAEILKLQRQLEKAERGYDAEIARLKEKRQQQEQAILRQEQQIRKLQDQVREQERRLQENAQELGSLRTYVYAVGDMARSRASESGTGSRCMKDPSRYIEEWNKKRVLVVGGHVNWQNKLKEYFPTWQFVDAGKKTLDGRAVVGKDFIICNTEMLNHACYFKLVAEKRKNQRMLYVHSCNIERCMWELEAQLV